MLKNTFLHVPGLGIKSEQRIWSSGIHSWDDLLRGDLKCFSLKMADTLRRSIEDSKEHLSRGNPDYFGNLLPSNQFWRIFPEFRESIAYLDIETTGLDSWGNQITTIALYDGKSIFTYVNGKNLDEFREVIQQFKVLVTYNGRCFDAPFIERYFNIKLPHAHIDLRFILFSLGFRGGLKGCEKQLGMDRGDLDGVDGFMAVQLWDRFQRKNDANALETLLAYNVQDTISLERLMVTAYNMKIKNTPFAVDRLLPDAVLPANPFKADVKLVDDIKKTTGYGGWYS